MTDPPPERSARVPTRRGPGERRTWNVEEAAAPGSTLRKHAPRRNALAIFSAVLRTRARLGKIAVGIFKHFILITVTQLTLKIRVSVGGGLAGFFFHRSLVEIAVRVLLFWHRALRDEGFALRRCTAEAGGPDHLRPPAHFGYRAAVTAFISV